jgi:hypothetical protein
MRQKERPDNGPPTGGGGDPGDELDELRERTSRFLAAGDEAIDLALANSNSEAFLRANRQHGGE